MRKIHHRFAWWISRCVRDELTCFLLIAFATYGNRYQPCDIVHSLVGHICPLHYANLSCDWFRNQSDKSCENVFIARRAGVTSTWCCCRFYMHPCNVIHFNSHIAALGVDFVVYYAKKKTDCVCGERKMWDTWRRQINKKTKPKSLFAVITRRLSVNNPNVATQMDPRAIIFPFAMQICL